MIQKIITVSEEKIITEYSPGLNIVDWPVFCGDVHYLPEWKQLLSVQNILCNRVNKATFSNLFGNIKDKSALLDFEIHIVDKDFKKVVYGISLYPNNFSIFSEMLYVDGIRMGYWDVIEETPFLTEETESAAPWIGLKKGGYPLLDHTIIGESIKNEVLEGIYFSEPVCGESKWERNPFRSALSKMSERLTDGSETIKQKEMNIVKFTNAVLEACGFTEIIFDENRRDYITKEDKLPFELMGGGFNKLLPLCPYLYESIYSPITLVIPLLSDHLHVLVEKHLIEIIRSWPKMSGQIITTVRNPDLVL